MFGTVSSLRRIKNSVEEETANVSGLFLFMALFDKYNSMCYFKHEGGIAYEKER